MVVIGSQAILATFPDAPESMLRSQEVDVYPRQHPEKADEIEGNLGDGSMFQRTYGYYAHGVGPETAKAPAGWGQRLIRIDIPPRVGSDRATVAFCLEPHDLVLAKCVAGRERDWDFAREALLHELVAAEVLFSRIDALPATQDDQSQLRERLEGLVLQVRRSE